MTPPPFRLFRNDIAIDSALDDAPLARTRDTVAGGRWDEARDLLSRTPADHDVYDHRTAVLAEAAALGVSEEWVGLEPDSTDAACLHALAAALRAVRGRAELADAEGACARAMQVAPHSTAPWLGQLMLAQHFGGAEEQIRAFDEIRTRYPWHHHAHHLITACLADRRTDLGDDPHHEVHTFADAVAEAAPPGSALVLLPLVAVAERYRALIAAGAESPDPQRSPIWNGQRARHAIESAFDWWLQSPARHPRLLVDLNHLAFAKWAESQRPQTNSLLGAIGSHVTAAPWAYVGKDPRRVFRAAREWTNTS